MDKSLRHAATIAMTVRHQIELARTHNQARLIEQRLLLAERMQQLAAIANQFHRAWRIHFRGASRRLQHRYDRQINELLHEIHHLQAMQNADDAPDHRLPTPQEILEELRQLEDEFGGWTLNNAGRQLIVATDSIVLEGVPLGRFNIVLDLHRLGDGSPHTPFHICALDPNPAAESDHVTHPHVSNEQLCAGEATTAIGAALRDGRLADFFLLVRNVLNTYNPESPYVSLDDWDAEACPECGYGMHEDNRCWCELCDRDYCDQCVGACRHCDQTTCFGCLLTCDYCDETFCRDCMRTCAGCGASCCPSCLEDELCPSCIEEKESNDDDDEKRVQEDTSEIDARTKTAAQPMVA